jgi:hypothetical protein
MDTSLLESPRSEPLDEDPLDDDEDPLLDDDEDPLLDEEDPLLDDDEPLDESEFERSSEAPTFI